jgi:hypothetical protein
MATSPRYGGTNGVDELDLGQTGGARRGNNLAWYTLQVNEGPDSGSTVYKLHLYLYDEVGNMEAPDSTPTLTVVNEAGTDRSANLGTVTAAGTGHYTVTYTVASWHAIEELLFEWSIVEGGITPLHGAAAQIVDTTAVDFTSTDRAKLDTLHDKRLTAGRAANLDNLDATMSSRATPAQVNTEADAALADVNLDHLVGTAAGIPALPVGTFVDQIRSDGTQTYDRTTDSLQAIRDRGDSAWGGSGGETRLREGTAQAGAAGTITLDAGASAVTDFYKNCICALTSGPGAGQSQIIASYVGSTKVATMAASWATAPDATTQFRVLPLGTIPGASAPTAPQVADSVLDALATEKITTNRQTGETTAYKPDGTTVRGVRRLTEVSDLIQGLIPQ